VKFDVHGIISMDASDVLKVTAWLSNPKETDAETKKLYSITGAETEKIPPQTPLYRIVYERLK
jgi:hypothetical protein